MSGPGGLTLRQIHEQVQKSVERDREAQATRDSLAPPQSRWQRWGATCGAAADVASGDLIRHVLVASRLVRN
jgi:hypothetical protein